MIDYNNLVVFVGAALLGAAAGLVGSFSVLRRRALAGDALAHATFPGLCLAFVVVGDRNLPALLLGALCSGWLGVAAISGLKRWTRIREDAAICIVLSTFFGAGIALARVIQNSSDVGSKAGLDSFLWGNTTAPFSEVSLLAIMAAVCVALVLLFFKEFKLTAFDTPFAQSQGWPVSRIDWLLMALSAVAVVIGLSAVGVVLMAALLILPAAAARFWTSRLSSLLALSAVFGMAACLIGTALSIRYERLPDGPFIILSGSALFFVSLLLAPRRGLIARWFQERAFRRELAAGEIGLEERRGPLPDELADMPQNIGVADSFQARGSRTANIDSEIAQARRGNLEPIHDISAMLKPLPASTPILGRSIELLFVVALAGALLARWWITLDAGDRPMAAWTIAIGCLTNIPCAVFGCFLLLRRRSVLGNGISHAVLPGISLALLFSGQITGLPIGVSAIAVGILTVLLARGLKTFGRVSEDSSLGIVYTTLFAAGVIMFTRIATKADVDPGCLLYGLLDVAALKTTTLHGWTFPSVMPTLIATCLYTFLFVWLLWKELKISTFDPALATAMGFNAGVIDYIVLGFMAAAVVAAFEAVGSILVVAMLIVPAATARMLTDRLVPTIGWSIAVALLSAIVGNAAALEFNTSAAGMMVVVAGLQFLLAVLLAPEHGLVSKWWRKFSLSVRIAAEDIVGMLYRAEEAAQRDDRLPTQTTWEQARGAISGFVGWLAIRHLLVHHEIYATAGGALELTDTGRESARSIVRSHRLWETYLGEKAELPLDHLHAPAERMEHFIGPELQEQIAAELAVADVDPHGREIPAETGWRRPLGTPSLPEVHRSVKVPPQLTLTVLPSRATMPVQLVLPHSISFWRMMLAFSGPGLMVSVGYMDPGNWATDIAGGARFGYTLLSVVLISNFMAMLLQYLALKLGVVTGRDLAQACRDHYSTPVAIGLWMLCELAIAACDLAEVIGSAIALNLLFGLPILVGVILTAADVFVILFLQFKGFRYIEALVVALIMLIGICFGYEIIASHPDWIGVAKGLIPHTQIVFNPEMLYIAIGILGATVMPHNLYLHSSIIQTRAYEQTDAGKARAIKFATIDSTFALFMAFFINAAILVLAAKAFHGTGHQDVADISKAYELLSPVLGVSLASILFAVALLASGQNSTLTGTLAGQIVMEGFLHIHIAPWMRRLVTRLMAIVPAVIVIAVWGEQYVGNLLILSQVVLSLQLPFAVFPLVAFTSDKAKMGRFANRPLMRSIVLCMAMLILALNVFLVYQTGKEWLGPANPASTEQQTSISIPTNAPASCHSE